MKYFKNNKEKYQFKQILCQRIYSAFFSSAKKNILQQQKRAREFNHKKGKFVEQLKIKSFNLALSATSENAHFIPKVLIKLESWNKSECAVLNNRHSKSIHIKCNKLAKTI